MFITECNLRACIFYLFFFYCTVIANIVSYVNGSFKFTYFINGLLNIVYLHHSLSVISVHCIHLSRQLGIKLCLQ